GLCAYAPSHVCPPMGSIAAGGVWFRAACCHAPGSCFFLSLFRRPPRSPRSLSRSSALLTTHGHSRRSSALPRAGSRDGRLGEDRRQLRRRHLLELGVGARLRGAVGPEAHQPAAVPEPPGLQVLVAD